MRKESLSELPYDHTNATFQDSEQYRYTAQAKVRPCISMDYVA